LEAQERELDAITRKELADKIKKMKDKIRRVQEEQLMQSQQVEDDNTNGEEEQFQTEDHEISQSEEDEGNTGGANN
jgi:ribosome-binding protein aMBF1 (putative translation factor)